MQTWTTEVWIAAGIGIIIGLILGYILCLLTHSSAKKQAQTQSDLKQAQDKLSEQQQQLEKHFAESAELFKTLIGDYQKLYRHYAAASNSLLGNKNNKGLFTQQLVTATATENKDLPPKDYSEEPSGLFNSTKE
ncbi:YhcB family protein [Rodentibacter caecimuris]|uniref:Z-ring associated protein G n=1 Tax=Rodentibacter caecimuris TaxID=1796644 RepID=A0ABX3L0A6_9PAST|nr:hypothetical protein BKG89_01440 [Rodentibacter heylii]